MKNRVSFTAFALSLVCAVAAQAQHGHGETDITIVADGPGAGSTLIMEYPFEKRSSVRVVPVDEINFPGLFSSTTPGFVPGEGNGLDEHELSVPTEIEVELVRRRGNVSFTVAGNGTATNPGDTVTVGTHSCQTDVDLVCENGGNNGTVCSFDLDCTGGGTCSAICEPDTSALHEHGEFLIDLMTPDSRTFGEGEITFRLNEGTGTSVGYLSSESVTLKISNGSLPGLEPATDDEATASYKCRKAVSKAVGAHIKKRQQLLGRCLDAVFAAEELGKSESAAVKACDVELPSCSISGDFCTTDAQCPLGEACQGNTKTLAAAARGDIAKQIVKLDKACEKDIAGSFGPFAESNLHTHLGMAACRTEELVAATYNNSRDEIVEILSHCDEGDLVCVAGPNRGLGCALKRCDDDSSNPGAICSEDIQCPGGACDEADDCDTEAIEQEVEQAFPCLKLSQAE